MCQFMHVWSGDSADDKFLVVDQILKVFAADDFFGGERFHAFNAWEVVKVFPDVVAFTLTEIEPVVGGSDHKVVEIPGLDL